MAQTQPREGSLNPPSPHSSVGGADSYKHEGTPDTRLTAFSPEENSAKSAKLIRITTSSPSDGNQAIYTAQQPSASPYRNALTQLEKDPFVSTNTPVRKQEQKLSATASAFRPFAAPLAAQGSPGSTVGTASKTPSRANPQHVLSVSPILSTDLHYSRCLVFSSPTQPVNLADVELLLSRLEEHGLPCQGMRHIVVKGQASYIRFSNIRDACLVHRNVLLGGATWIAAFVSPTEFVQITQSNVHAPTNYEGQLSVFAAACEGAEKNELRVESVALRLLCSEGDIFALQKVSNSEPGTFEAILEYADINTSLAAISKYNGAIIEGVTIVISFHKGNSHAGVATPIVTPLATPVRQSSFRDYGGDSYQSAPLAKTPQSASSMGTPAQPATPHVGLPLSPQYPLFHPLVFRQLPMASPYMLNRLPSQSSPAPSMSSYQCLTPMYTSPASSQAVISSQQDLMSPRQMQGFARHDGRRQNAMRVNRSSYYNAAGHHNQVDVNRIQEGIDVRTTIMLRNIPNKVDQAMLKRIVDESSWGKYDFMYLRIDFANDCNVGYAFINFVDPLDIIDFVNTRGNQRWNCFKSDKVAEISYATIQGKDCLVQKFRNSSVMLEAAHYRPKLYFTSNGPVPEMAGEEEQFPEPDNQSKMKRSCENAEHVGLFTPNAGQHFRDEQRRRRSQYDRGTRLAALEEYDFDRSMQTSMQQLYVSQ
ncbi:hypothetical protein RB595_001370 [Gaeumannomyces hyphopodioides]